MEVGENVRITGALRIYKNRHAEIRLCDKVVLNSLTSRNTLEARGPVILRCVTERARIVIGADSGLTSSTVSCAESITIGARVLIGAGVVITDSDHHVVEPTFGESRRYIGFPRPKQSDAVVISDDVFIGARSIILKGVNIGQGAVIGAGSVVTSNVAPYTVVAGNPAKEVRRLRGASR